MLRVSSMRTPDHLARWIRPILAILAWVVPSPVLAQGETASSLSFVDQPLISMAALFALTLLPFAFMVGTSFAKMSVVFSLLRNALGTGNVPSGMVLSGLAAILSIYVMTPVFDASYAAAAPDLVRVNVERPLEGASLDALLDAFAGAAGPFIDFLERNTGEREHLLFTDLARRGSGPDLQERDVRILLPAFLVTELSEAFQIGFLIFLPFLIVDVVVSNVLLALGMHMMSPTTVSLPFKLLLFVMVDGFYLLSRALVLGYAP